MRDRAKAYTRTRHSNESEADRRVRLDAEAATRKLANQKRRDAAKAVAAAYSKMVQEQLQLQVFAAAVVAGAATPPPPPPPPEQPSFAMHGVISFDEQEEHGEHDDNEVLDDHDEHELDEQEEHDQLDEQPLDDELGSPASSPRACGSPRFHTPTVPAGTRSPIATRLRVDRKCTTNDDKMLAEWGWVDPTTTPKRARATVSEAEYAELLDQGNKIVKLIQEDEHPELIALLNKLPPLTRRASQERSMAATDYSRLQEAEKKCPKGGTYTVKVRSRSRPRAPAHSTLYSSTYRCTFPTPLVSPSWAKKA
jgi:hypothetical protein